MSRIRNVFEDLKQKNRKALITYVTVGDPDFCTSTEIILQMIRNGADMIELGMPFSDPVADGPVIQAASRRALQTGITLSHVFDLAREIRRVSQIPLILFGYCNPFFAFGLKETCQSAKKAGIDGLLVVDVPYEEADELKQHADEENLDLIFLVAPTTDRYRLEMIARKARGFLYYISTTGVTGSQGICHQINAKKIKEIKEITDLPVVIGFGISTPAQAFDIGKLADGVVVGSAIVRIIEQNQYSPKSPEEVGAFVRQLKKAL